MDLRLLGWDDFFARHFLPFAERALQPGRVLVEHRNSYQICGRQGELTAEAAGRLLHIAGSGAALPKVGDWVAFATVEPEGRGIIHEVLPRKTSFSRKVAGKETRQQIIASNIDTVFVVQSLDRDYNPRRLERTLVLVREGGADAAVVLNKADICEDAEVKRTEVEKLTGSPVLVVSGKTGAGLETLEELIETGRTYAFIGSSGVGKSTLINRLFGQEVLPTREVRPKDARGRHTTTRRELVLRPQGGCLIDTPGMRELQLWHVDTGLTETFADIEDLAENCHFSDCSHTREIKCAVLAALEAGELSRERYDNYLKMQKELAFLESKDSPEAQLKRKKQEKTLQKEYKRYVSKRRKK